ncbi:MAG: precorrin-3B C(17)-methyltransferase [Nitrospirota bacterium]
MHSKTMKGMIYLIGFGPGDIAHITPSAQIAIMESEIIIGYKTYIRLLNDLIKNKEIISSGMKREIERARTGVRLAEEGRTLSIISSGDPGIYGMASPLLEVLKEEGWSRGSSFDVKIIPGIPALSSAASLLGSPIVNDFASVSLSDLLTPWDTITRRIRAAAEGDFVIVIYNPKSIKRVWQISDVQKIILEYRDGNTPVGIVNNAYRMDQEVILTQLNDMLNFDIGMQSLIIIGSSETFVFEGFMITPRGYREI